jgi:hypothetical protein
LRIGVGVVVGMVVGLVVGLVMALQVARVVGVVGGWSGRNGAMPLTPGRAHALSVLEARRCEGRSFESRPRRGCRFEDILAHVTLTGAGSS